MKVELAWLADATTFPYQLDARAAGGALEVRGYVANEAVKAHALEVARRHTALPVTDALKVYPGLVPRTAGVPSQTLEEGASRVLADKMGERARTFDVKAGANGQVTVAGSVLSVEEKLAVSRCLRRLRGCTAVANRLAVVPVKHEGRLLTRVTADGKQVADGRTWSEEGEGPDPSLLPQARVASDAGKVRPALTGPRLPPDSTQVGEGSPASPVSQVSSTAPAPPPASPGAAWAWGDSTYAPAVRPQVSALQPNGGDLPPVTLPAPGSVSPYAPPAGGSRGGTLPEAGARSPYTTSGVVLMEEEPQPVLLSQTTVLAMTRLRQRVKMVCGRMARDVQVVVLPDRSMRVVVQVDDAAAEKQLRPRIMELTELASPTVRLEIQTLGRD
jgi:hypothetical protein